MLNGPCDFGDAFRKSFDLVDFPDDTASIGQREMQRAILPNGLIEFVVMCSWLFEGRGAWEFAAILAE